MTYLITNTNNESNITTYILCCYGDWGQYMLKCKAEYLAPRRQTVAKITTIGFYFQFYVIIPLLQLKFNE